MASKKKPFNCFLMGDNSKIFKSDQGFEIVALCLDTKDACPGIF